MIRHIKKRKVFSRFDKKNERNRLKVNRNVTGKMLEPVISKGEKLTLLDRIATFKSCCKSTDWWGYSSYRYSYFGFGNPYGRHWW